MLKRIETGFCTDFGRVDKYHSGRLFYLGDEVTEVFKEDEEGLQVMFRKFDGVVSADRVEMLITMNKPVCVRQAVRTFATGNSKQIFLSSNIMLRQGENYITYKIDGDDRNILTNIVLVFPYVQNKKYKEITFKVNDLVLY